MIPWQKIFTQLTPGPKEGSRDISTLPDLRDYLDAVHVRHCLVKPYQEREAYPLVEARELLPSFESDMFEYEGLPGFALVAFGRQLDYFAEIFQYDKLRTVEMEEEGQTCPLNSLALPHNVQAMTERLPRCLHTGLRAAAEGKDLTRLEHYPALLPYLLEMDRAQVLALDENHVFHLAGIFASFPSDMDSEIKRFGTRIGKFAYGDSAMYERNRTFVYQYLMELYGFPVVSERRTSSAMFARKLHRMGENFILRVMGQSDRTITTYTADSETKRYPRVDKLALVAVDADQGDVLDTIAKRGFFLDAEKRVVIMRITYRQHRFDPDNVRQDRALSVAAQEVLHPLTGQPLRGLNIIKDASNIFLRLNDIVRGEYTGRIIYKRTEIVENTDTDEKRLKFLHTWLIKHQRRMISYPDEFFEQVIKVISSYLKSPDKSEIFAGLRGLYQEINTHLSYIRQARRVRILEDLGKRFFKGKRIGYREMCRECVALLQDLQFEIVNFFPDLVDSIIKYMEQILHDRYLQRAYVKPPEHSLSRGGLEVRKNYGRMVALLDAIKSVRKSRMKSETQENNEEVGA